MNSGSDSTSPAPPTGGITPLGVVRLGAPIAPQPGRAFDADDSHILQPGFPHLLCELRRRVEERGREPSRRAIGVAMRAGLQIGGDDRPEACVGDHPFPEAAEHRRQPGNRRGDHGSPRTHDPRCLLEHCHSIEAVEQVVERPEQEHVVERPRRHAAAALLHRAQPAPARGPLPASNGAAPDRARSRAIRAPPSTRRTAQVPRRRRALGWAAAAGARRAALRSAAARATIPRAAPPPHRRSSGRARPGP